METGAPHVVAGALSPLKPSLVEWKPQTLLIKGSQALFLETFLSGMETKLHNFSLRGLHSLKPSLVEWKLVVPDPDRTCRQPLKPSLVEWKLLPQGRESSKVHSLKPSLVEWKHRWREGKTASILIKRHWIKRCRGDVQRVPEIHGRVQEKRRESVPQWEDTKSAARGVGSLSERSGPLAQSLLGGRA